MIDQDPVALGDAVVKASRKALTVRYEILPYLYSLFVQAHLFGTPVARPLFFNFPGDRSAYGISDSQFMLGDALLIVPVLEEVRCYPIFKKTRLSKISFQGATKVQCYLPPGSVWYNYYDGKAVTSGGGFVDLDAPLDTIPVLVNGGKVLFRKKSGAATTTER